MTVRRAYPITVGGLLFPHGAADALAERLADPGVRAVLEAQTGPVGRQLLDGARDRIAEAAGAFLSADLSSLLVAGWTAHRALLAAAAETCRPYPAPAEQRVELATHEIALTQHPEVEVTLDGRPVVCLRFELAVVVTVYALAAVVRVGRLVAVESGTCQVSAALGVQGAELATTTRVVAAPRLAALGDGIALALPRFSEGSAA